MIKRLGDAAINVPATVMWLQENSDPPVSATFDVIDGMLQCREVVIRARPGQREIKRADLRAVPIDDLREQVAEFWSVPFEHSQGGTTLKLMIGDESQAVFGRHNLAATRRRADAETLSQVAEVYRENESTAPTRAVAEALGVAHRTAGLYVQRARKAGLLEPPAKRAAREGKADG